MQRYLVTATMLSCIFVAAPAFAEDPLCSDEYGATFPCPFGSAPAGKKAIYMDLRDGSVTDLRADFTWEKGDDKTRRSWQEAVDYCDSLELGGKDNWRLPTNQELLTITEYGRSQNVMNEIFSYVEGNYWTATPHPGETDRYLTIGYFDSDSNAHPVSSTHLVRCISTNKYLN